MKLSRSYFVFSVSVASRNEIKLPEVIDQAALNEKSLIFQKLKLYNFSSVRSIFWFTLERIPLLWLNKTDFYFNKIPVINGMLCVIGIHILCT